MLTACQIIGLQAFPGQPTRVCKRFPVEPQMGWPLNLKKNVPHKFLRVVAF